MSKTSLDDILGDFNPSEIGYGSNLKSGAPIAVWLTAEDKARYDRLQKVSGRRFCKKIRELIRAAMDVAETRAS